MNILSICIPTYNRPLFIKEQLDKILPITKLYNVQIYISDNSENADTQIIVDSYNSDLITYSRNEQNICDRNFLKVLIQPDSKYRWLLSDSNYFSEELLLTILKKCETNEYDYIFLNSGRVNNIENEKVYDDQKLLLVELGWHLTHISALIFSDRIFSDLSLISRYLQTNFIHHSLIFELWAHNKYKALWIQNPCYNTNNLIKPNSWNNMVFEIWVKRWTDYVLSLPYDYGLSAKQVCIRKHNTATELFSYRKILRYYTNDVISKKDYKKHSEYFKISLNKKETIFLRFLFIIPQTFLQFIKKRRKVITVQI